MPRLSEYIPIYQKEQPVLLIAAQTNLANLVGIIRKSKEKIKKYMKTLGEYPTDVPFVVYHNNDLDNLDIEICFPTRKPLRGEGEIRYSSILPNKAIICMLKGNHDERKNIYDDMLKWIKEKGYEYVGEAYESFYFDSRDPGNPYVFVKIIIPVK